VLVGDGVCDRFHEGLVIQKPYWVIKDLQFRDHGRSMSIYADHVEIANNVIAHFREEGIRVDGITQGRVQFADIHDNVIANGDTCTGQDSPAVYLVRNADNNTVMNNIIMATGDNGYTCGNEGGCVGAKLGYGMLISINADSNLVQGNLFLGNSGKGVFRILSTDASASSNQNIVRDNAFLFGEGAVSSDNCTDDSNQFLNNIMYGNYFWNWYTKGNDDGTKGHHTLQHNLFYATEFTRGNGGLVTGGQPFCPNGAGYSYKISNILKDNLFYANSAQTGNVDSHVLLTVQGQNADPSSIAQADHNLFWAPGDPSTWTYGYTFDATDIHSPAQQPVFTDATNGDFSLAAGSPGKGAASDGKDIGIEYNAYLKKSWLRHAFTLPTQQQDNLTTSASFTVSPNHYYQIWFYIPTTNPYQGVETFSVEATSLQRDIKTLSSVPPYGQWVQPNGPARWITLGRAKAADGTLNISWSNPGSASKIFIRQLPTADEAYTWIAQRRSFPPPPTNLRIFQQP
jgi:hypothetical protein